MTDDEITVEALSKAMADGIEDGDVTRARGLSSLLDIRLARLDGLRRELDLRRLADDADPRLAVLQQRLASDELVVRALDQEALRAASTPATAVEDAATIQGRLVTDTGEVPDGARARIRDGSGRLVPGVEGTVDKGGGFHLKLPLAGGSKLDLSTITVVLADTSGRELARDDTPIVPRAGFVEYREIALPVKGRAAATGAAGAAGGAGVAGDAGAAGGTAGTDTAKPRRGATARGGTRTTTKPTAAARTKPAGEAAAGSGTTAPAKPKATTGRTTPAKPKATGRTTVTRATGTAGGTVRRASSGGTTTGGTGRAAGSARGPGTGRARTTRRRTNPT